MLADSFCIFTWEKIKINQFYETEGKGKQEVQNN